MPAATNVSSVTSRHGSSGPTEPTGYVTCRTEPARIVPAALRANVSAAGQTSAVLFGSTVLATTSNSTPSVNVTYSSQYAGVFVVSPDSVMPLGSVATCRNWREGSSSRVCRGPTLTSTAVPSDCVMVRGQSSNPSDGWGDAFSEAG